MEFFGGEGGGDRLISTSLGSIVEGSIAAGLWEEEDEEAEEEERAGGGKAGEWRPGPMAALFRDTWLFLFLMRERRGFPSTLFWRILTHSSASSGLAAISTKRSCPPSDGPLLFKKIKIKTKKKGGKGKWWRKCA